MVLQIDFFYQMSNFDFLFSGRVFISVLDLFFLFQKILNLKMLLTFGFQTEKKVGEMITDLQKILLDFI